MVNPLMTDEGHGRVGHGNAMVGDHHNTSPVIMIVSEATGRAAEGVLRASRYYQYRYFVPHNRGPLLFSAGLFGHRSALCPLQHSPDLPPCRLPFHCAPFLLCAGCAAAHPDPVLHPAGSHHCRPAARARLHHARGGPGAAILPGRLPLTALRHSTALCPGLLLCVGAGGPGRV